MRTKAALGFSVHTGWAALVAAAGPPDAPVLVARATMEMIRGDVAEQPRFVYHAARSLALDEARRFVAAAAAASRKRARVALAACLDDVRARGHDVVAAGIIVANQPVEAALSAILANHSLVHAAEGELYRGAIAAACEAAELRLVAVRARELAAEVAPFLGAGAALSRSLAAVGKAAGKPWAKDQKDALCAAVVALAGRPARR